MYSDLNMWDNATLLAQESNIQISDILRKKALAQKDLQDSIAAANTLIDIGDYQQAIELLGQNNHFEKLVELVRRLTKANSKELSRCIHYFRIGKQYPYMCEALLKLGDFQQLLKTYIELHRWEESFQLVEMHPHLGQQFYLPYAEWLASEERFVEAQSYFRKAGQIEAAVRVLEQLASNAIVEKRFDDASYYYWTLGTELFKTSKTKEAKEYMIHSQIYHAYHYVFRYLEEPFSLHLEESIFSMARFVYCHLKKSKHPLGISIVNTLFALSKLSMKLGAFKLARACYDHLRKLHIPKEWRMEIEISCLKLNGYPEKDAPELNRQCFSCGTINPPLGENCTQCNETFVYSFYSFNELPLVQFQPDQALSTDEVFKLIQTEPLHASGGLIGAHAKSLTIEQLLNLDPHSVFRKNKRNEYFRLAVPLSEAHVKQCQHCEQFFLEEEWAYQVLSMGQCHFCRVPTLPE